VRGVDVSQLVSFLNQVPRRVQSAPEVLRAMAEVSNEEIVRLMASPYILYVEGESDERILRAWANPCGAQAAMGKVCFKAMGGGDKQIMKTRADDHFAALKQIIPEVRRLMLFDYDDRATFHPDPDNPALAEWKRRNIENYLLVPDAWKRAARFHAGKLFAGELFEQPVMQAIDEFFVGQNLTLPPGRTWRNVNANVFSAVDGKGILFEDDNSLFQQLRNRQHSVQLNPEQIAATMLASFTRMYTIS